MRAWIEWRKKLYSVNPEFSSGVLVDEWVKETLGWGHHLISVNPSDRVEFDQQFEMNCYRFSKFIELVYKGE